MNPARPKYFADLNIFVGRKCNAACDHCSVYSSPEAVARMSAGTMDGVIKLIAEFAAVGPGGKVLVTGGEPLLFASELAMLSEVTKSHGLHLGFETSAFWAKTGLVARITHRAEITLTLR